MIIVMILACASLDEHGKSWDSLNFLGSFLGPLLHFVELCSALARK